jgi:hypothetical protein
MQYIYEIEQRNILMNANDAAWRLTCNKRAERSRGLNVMWLDSLQQTGK